MRTMMRVFKPAFVSHLGICLKLSHEAEIVYAYSFNIIVRGSYSCSCATKSNS